MITAAFLLLGANVPSEGCYPLKPDANAYDVSLYPSDYIMNVTPAKLRECSQEHEARKRERKKASRKKAR